MSPTPKKTLLSRCLLLLILIAAGCISGNVYAQNQKVVTAMSGVQYEGDLFYVKEYSPSMASFSPLPSGNDIVVVDDGLRRVLLNVNSIAVGLGESQRNEIEFDIRQKEFKGSVGNGQLIFQGPFDRHGHRELVIRDPLGKRKRFIQGITKITPRYCVVNTLSGANNPKQFRMPLSTATINKDIIRNLLLGQIDDQNVNDYFDIADYFRQTGDFQRASDELLLIEQRFPEQGERVRDERTEIAQLFGRQILEEIKLRLANGQTKLAVAMAQAIDSPDYSLDIRAEFNDFQDKKDQQQQQLENARSQTLALTEGIKNLSIEQSAVVEKFKHDLNNELTVANVDRLDAFLRVVEDDSTPKMQKLSLAISGWLLGSNNAVENFALALSLYPAKKLALEYLARDTSADRRATILAELESFESTGLPNYIDPILKLSKPIDAPDLSTYDGSKPIEFFIEVPGPPVRPEVQRFRCLAHLPTEYDPHRKYPTIISLPGGGQSLEQNLNLWCGSHNEPLSSKLNLAVRNGPALRQGYIVVAVDWRYRGQTDYRYTTREHRIVTDALYESLRQFSVNPDRVYLSGHGTGGSAAYDIGVSHPEHWAGVLGFSGAFDKYVDQYQANQHVGLPMYAVFGEKDKLTADGLRGPANKWLKSKLYRYIDLTMVQYKGRMNEYFPEDIPNALKWMRGQQRRRPSKTDFSFECRGMRPGDCYFWFFEMDGIPANMTYPPALYDQQKFKRIFTMSAKLKKENTFLLEPRSLQMDVDATLWLSPEFADFSKRIEIKGRGSFKGDVTPSTKTLLDDVLRRADTKHPYWARIKCVKGTWAQAE